MNLNLSGLTTYTTPRDITLGSCLDVSIRPSSEEGNEVNFLKPHLRTTIRILLAAGMIRRQCCYREKQRAGAKSD